MFCCLFCFVCLFCVVCCLVYKPVLCLVFNVVIIMCLVVLVIYDGCGDGGWWCGMAWRGWYQVQQPFDLYCLKWCVLVAWRNPTWLISPIRSFRSKHKRVCGGVWCGGVVVWWCGGVVVWWCGGMVVDIHHNTTTEPFYMVF